MKVAAEQRCAAVSDIGLKRKSNQDRVYFEPGGRSGIVADGCGGESGGDIAAEQTVEAFRDCVKAQGRSVERIIRLAFAIANQRIHEAQLKREHGRMCCTAAAFVRDERGNAAVAVVGDAVCWLITPESISSLTLIESPVGRLRDTGRISDQEALHYPGANRVYRALGIIELDPDQPSDLYVRCLQVQPRDALLLTTDGIHGQLTRAEIFEIICAHADDARRLVHALVEAANLRGGKDNATAVFSAGTQFAAAIGTERWPDEAVQTPAGGAETGLAPHPAALAHPDAHQPKATVASSRGFRVRLLSIGAVLLAAGVLVGLTLMESAQPAVTRPAQPRLLIVSDDPKGISSISSALARSRPGDAVEIHEGLYAENTLSIPDDVHVYGAPNGTVRIKALQSVAIDSVGSGSTLSSVVVLAAGRGIVISAGDLKMDGVEIAGGKGAGVEIRGSATPRISGLWVHDGSATPVRIEDSAHPVISESTICAPPEVPGLSLNGPRARVTFNRGSIAATSGEWISAKETEQVSAFGTVYIPIGRAAARPASNAPIPGTEKEN
jgi:serine/threonine protein phosphatase PrpC